MRPNEDATTPDQPAYPVGQRLVCDQCHAEIEITSACPCTPPDQVLRCCGQEMRPSTVSPNGPDVRSR